MITEDQKHQFILLRAKGNSFDKIAIKLSISKPTLIKLSSELEHEISNNRKMFRESILEGHSANIESRIECLAILHQKLKKEILERDLSDIHTDKIIDLFHKNSKELSTVEDTFQEFSKLTDGIGSSLFTHVKKWGT